MDILDKEVEVYNDGELVLEGLLNEFLEINKEDREYILSQIDVNKKYQSFMKQVDTGRLSLNDKEAGT